MKLETILSKHTLIDAGDWISEAFTESNVTAAMKEFGKQCFNAGKESGNNEGYNEGFHDGFNASSDACRDDLEYVASTFEDYLKILEG